jgi:hypothetical protein
MAIIGTPIFLNADRSQEKTASAKSRSEKYLVKTEVGVGDEMSIALGHALFLIDRPHLDVTGLYLKSATAEPTEGDTSVWMVSLEWETGTLSIGGGERGDPIDFELKFDWGSWAHPQAIVQDTIGGFYISNTAGQPYLNPPLQEELFNPMVTITVNQPEKVVDHLREGVGRMNTKPIVIDGVPVPPFCAKLVDYVSNERSKPDSDDIYVQSRYTYHLNFEKAGPRTFTGEPVFSGIQNPLDLTAVAEGDFKGFRRKVLSAGINEINKNAELIKITDGDGGYISEPVPLDENGQAFKTSALGKEIYLLYNTLETVDFTGYPLNKIG